MRRNDELFRNVVIMMEFPALLLKCSLSATVGQEIGFASSSLSTEDINYLDDRDPQIGDTSSERNN